MLIKRIFRVALLLILAAGFTTVLCSIAVTQFNLGRLIDLGLDISLADRIRATGHDLKSMGPFYGGVIASALVVAFPVAALLTRWFEAWRPWLYILAGTVAIFVLLWAMKVAFGLHIIAAVRTPLGFASQVIAGGAGGWLFARLTRARAA